MNRLFKKQLKKHGVKSVNSGKTLLTCGLPADIIYINKKMGGKNVKKPKKT